MLRSMEKILIKNKKQKKNNKRINEKTIKKDKWTYDNFKRLQPVEKMITRLAVY